MISMTTLIKVEKLTITFLVDNSIEWMTKMPPGFSGEVRNHLADDPPIDELTGVPILDLENYCCGEYHIVVRIVANSTLAFQALMDSLL